MSTNILYHTRLLGQESIKVTGGTFGGSLSIDTANRLVNAFFDVKVKSTGYPYFVDNKGREVNLYMRVDAKITDKGKAAIEQYNKGVREKLRLLEEKEKEIEEAMQDLTHEEILRRLRG